MPHNVEDIGDYHAGDALDIVCTAKDDAGNVIDITNANEIRWLLKDNETDDDSVARLDKRLTATATEITITDGANGEFEIYVDTGDTDGMSGDKHHRCRLEDSTGDRSTVFHGTFSISV